MKQLLSTILLFSCVVFSSQAVEIFNIEIKDHKFSPAEITIPANQKVKLIVKNLDASPEEFESHDLHREKLVTGNGQAAIYIGPLKPGKYHFYGEFNPDSAQGHIIAK